MNRREALAALTSLPMLKGVEVASLKPGDVIIAEVPGAISIQTAERLKAELTRVWPDTEIVVCGDGMRLKVMRPA